MGLARWNARGAVRIWYAPGDLLWVRETWCDPIGEREPVYRADQRPEDDAEELRMRRAGIKSDAPWRSPIHMPREFSRITLRVTGVRAQRLQEINYDDAAAEGIDLERYIPVSDSAGMHACGEAEPTDPIAEYRDLWNSINANRGYSWESNPWVAAITFERIDNG